MVLVVRSLHEGLTNGDSMRTLEARLRNFSFDLEDFFGHMIASVDTLYQKDMARTFQEAIQATEPLPLIAHSFLDESDPDYALRLSLRSIDACEINSRLEKMRRRINGRSKGLLEVCRSSSNDELGDRVEFLHRTVRDFLLTKDLQHMLNHHLDDTFNPNRSLCRGYLALMKTFEVNLVGKMMHYASLAEIEMGTSDRIALEELELTLRLLRSRLHSRLRPNLPKRSEPQNALHVDGFGPRIEYFSVVQLGVTYGLRLFVEEKLKMTPSIVHSHQPSILGFALQTRHATQEVAQIAHMLLRSGADPNCIDPSTLALRPAWHLWLVSIIKAYRSTERYSIRLQTLETLLQFGADPNLRNNHSTPWRSALECLYAIRKDRKTETQMTYLFGILKLLLIYGAAADTNFVESGSIASSPRTSLGSLSSLDWTLPPSLNILLPKVINSFSPSLAAQLWKRFPCKNASANEVFKSSSSLEQLNRPETRGASQSTTSAELPTLVSTRQGCCSWCSLRSLFGCFCKGQ